MDSNVIEGKWNQLRGSIRERWGDLTDDDLAKIAGKRDRLIGLLQEKYGYSRERAEQEVSDFLREQQRQV